jgi:hypothetical protein
VNIFVVLVCHMSLQADPPVIITVKNVPVNYAIRFSGPVTALTARRVWYGVASASPVLRQV